MCLIKFLDLMGKCSVLTPLNGPCFKENLKFMCGTWRFTRPHKNSPLVSVLSQMNPSWDPISVWRDMLSVLIYCLHFQGWTWRQYLPTKVSSYLQVHMASLLMKSTSSQTWAPKIWHLILFSYLCRLPVIVTKGPVSCGLGSHMLHYWQTGKHAHSELL